MSAAPAVSPAHRPILVLSVGHSLLPFAFRLQREGHEVQVACVHCPPRYQEAWGGKFSSFLPPSKGGVEPEVAEKVVDAARSAGALVLTNSLKWTEALRGAALDGVFGQPQRDEPRTNLQIGAWFDGKAMRGTHLLAWDQAAWPGGLGPFGPGGAVLVRAPHLSPFLEPCVDQLAESGYRGLVAMDLQATPQGRLAVSNLTLGWHRLHAHAFVSELESLSAVLEGAEPVQPKRFVCAVPVSVPPWPSPVAREVARVPIAGLSREQMGQVFFHDMKIVEGQPQVAGLDGLVFVARGAADSFELARLKASTICAAVQLPEKQWRPDFGSAVPGIVAALEQLGVSL